MDFLNETMDLFKSNSHDKPGIILPSENQTDSMNNQLKAYNILIPALGTIIVLTNLVVVVSSGLILKTGQQRKCTYLLLGNVAMSDLITGIAVIVGNVYPKQDRTHLVCTIQMGMIVSTTVASIYSVGLIAIDRYLYIVHGLMYNQWMYPKRARIGIIFTWIFGLIIGFLPMMGWSGNTDSGRICWLTFVFPPELIIIVTVLGFVPVFLVIYLYSIILVKATKKVIQLNNSNSKNPQGESKGELRIFRGNRVANKVEISTIENEVAKHGTSTNDDTTKEGKSVSQSRFSKLKSKQNKDTETENNESNDKDAPNKWKAIKVVMLTTGSFVCTWAPYFVACTIFVFCDFDKTPQMCQSLKYAIASPLAILGFFNSLLNPIIYAWWHNGFRKTLRKIFRKKKDNTVVTTSRTAHSRSTHSSSTTSTSLSGGRIPSIEVTPHV